MKQKFKLIILLALAFLFTLSACGGQDTSEGGTVEPSQIVEADTGGNGDVAADPLSDADTLPVDDTSEVETSTETAEIETPVPTEETLGAEPPAPSEETTTTQQPQQELFSPVSEVVYATTTVNVRDTYSTSGNKLGSLTKAQSVTRTGIGQGAAEGWSQVAFAGQVAYVSSQYLSTTKPQVSTGNSGSSSSNSGSTQNSTPSTGSSSQSSSGNTGGSTSSGGSSSSGGSLADKAEEIAQHREDLGYSGADAGGYLTDEDRDWITGEVQLGN